MSAGFVTGRRVEGATFPLASRDRVRMFDEWCRRNPGPLAEIEQWALEMYRRNLRISTKYLIEKQRYEGYTVAEPVPYTDQRGRTHMYRINNSDTSLLARWLLLRYPGMDIKTRASRYDDAGVA